MSARPLTIALLSAILAAALPGAASATTKVSLSPSQLTVIGDAGRNDVKIVREPDGYRVVDTSAPMNVTAPCIKIGDEVECQSSSEVLVRVELRAGSDLVELTGTHERSELLGENGEDLLRGGPGDDRLFGDDGQDTLIGRSGDDVLNGGIAPDVMDGSSGTDTINYGDRNAAVSVNLETGGGGGEQDKFFNLVGVLRQDTYNSIENVIGTTSNDVIVGSDSANRLSGLAGTDVISGREGDDRLDGGAGPDTLIGNGGRDTALYTTRTESVRVILDGAANDGGASDSNLDDVRDDVEVVDGGRADDVLVGSASANTLRGNLGDDDLDGGAGPDQLLGGDGRDTVRYLGSAGVTVDLDGAADDGGAADLFGDDVEVERVLGTVGDDRLTGDAGANSLSGGAGRDTLLGGDGEDELDGGEGPDVLDGQAGRDVATYALGFPRLSGVQVALDELANDGSLVDTGLDGGRDLVLTEDVTGTPVNDVLIGDSGANILLGEDGNDVVRGGGGDDRLDGGAGLDRLLGEDGGDFLDADDGQDDRVGCGAGKDSAVLDLRDVDAGVTDNVIQPSGSTPPDCESVTRAPRGELPAVAITTTRLALDRAGRAHVGLRCPRAVKTRRCAGRLVALLGGRRLASGRFRLRPGARGTVHLRFRAAARRRLAGAPRLLLEARDRARDGRPRTSRVTVRVQA